MNDIIGYYNDDYQSCNKTFATLRIYGELLNFETIRTELDVGCTSSQKKGVIATTSNGTRITPLKDGWFLSSKDYISSKDSLRHLDWIVQSIGSKKDGIRNLVKLGYKIDVVCYWRSAEGHGGPRMRPQTMEKLAALGIELSFDFYC